MGQRNKRYKPGVWTPDQQQACSIESLGQELRPAPLLLQVPEQQIQTLRLNWLLQWGRRWKMREVEEG